MKIDPKFTKKIQDWLNKEPKVDANAISGAQLLQQINPRNTMYRRFITLSVQRPSKILPKIEYELNVHLKYRLDGLTLEEVNRLDHTVVPEASRIITEGKPFVEGDMTLLDEAGDAVVPLQTVLFSDAEPDAQQHVRQLGRRQDHDKLPDNIKKLWDDNGKLYKDIKDLFEELKSMEELPSCQRYDKLQMLAAMDRRYFKQMKEYDDYVVDAGAAAHEGEKGKEDGANADEQQLSDVAVSAKEVTTARSYISKYQKKLADLHAASVLDRATEKEQMAYAELLAKVQERADVLVKAQMITDEMKESLAVLGVVFNQADNESTAAAEGSEAAE